MPPPLTLLVLYVTDLKRSHRFYTDLGLTLFEEQHGDGPVHYSAMMGEVTVLELYPCDGGPPTRTRLGFAVPDLGYTAEMLGATRYPVVPRPGMTLTARDPDGNVVELTMAEG